MNRSILTCLALGGLLAVAAVAAAGEDTPVVKGESWIGAHYLEANGHFDKVGEYFSDANAGEFQAHGFFELGGAADGTLFDLFGFYRDRDTKGFGLDLNTDGRVNASFDYQQFIHHLDHDLLMNMQAREGMPNDALGGKQVYNHDMDPMGRSGSSIRSSSPTSPTIWRAWRTASSTSATATSTRTAGSSR